MPGREHRADVKKLDIFHELQFNLSIKATGPRGTKEGNIFAEVGVSFDQVHGFNNIRCHTQGIDVATELLDDIAKKLPAMIADIAAGVIYGRQQLSKQYTIGVDRGASGGRSVYQEIKNDKSRAEVVEEVEFDAVKKPPEIALTARDDVKREAARAAARAAMQVNEDRDFLKRAAPPPQPPISLDPGSYDAKEVTYDTGEVTHGPALDAGDQTET